ncbi:MAG: S41 family peptidase [Deltaproteobacteria bacterium]|nr:S41 family peptidase [Deltaproteobacteria bacterium]
MRTSHVVGTCLMVLSLACMPGPGLATDQDLYGPLKRFSKVLDLVEENYVHPVDREEAMNGAIKGMLQKLDPHSTFIEAKEFVMMQEEFAGEFGGIGVQIGIKDRRLTVIAPIEDTPADKAGLLAGDIILEINGEPTQDFSLTEAVNRIRGPKGEAVTLTIMHKDSRRPERVTIVRGAIPIYSVKSMPLEPGYMYLQLTDFKATTLDEMRKAVTEFAKSTPLKGLVLDLRNNPGGLLDQAVSVSDAFLEGGLIVYTQGREENSRREYKAKKQDDDILCPMVILINSGSASASEIVAGALQDQNRAVLIGEKTFGKGSVQTMIPLDDGSAVKLTIALYYTPNGRSIQAQGIAPDLEVPLIVGATRGGDDQLFTLREENLSEHLDNPDQPDSEDDADEVDLDAAERLERDNQLRLALQIVKSLPRLGAVSAGSAK